MKIIFLSIAGVGLVLADGLDDMAQRMLAARKSEIAKITTVDQARARQKAVRAKVLELIGGLPDYSGPLNARMVGAVPRKGFTIEKVLFESLPQFWVAANVYRPDTPGKYPAVLIPMGHWDSGKAAAQLIAANLALKGFVAMPFDPIGQGERQQAYDKRTGTSLIGGPTDQHFIAGAQAMMVGQSFARYRIWDAKRGIDYLVSRPDVDGGRIGVTGCSGGGTLTTYIAALDDRVKVAAPTCYMNTFEKLIGGIGPQDSEQTINGFLSSGLDITDYVEAFAPKPWLMGSTEQDFFPLAGARIVYEEGQRWYSLFDAQDRIKWVVGPGGHGTPLNMREGIYEWMIRWLRDGKGDAKEIAVETLPAFDLLVTSEGQVPGRDVYEIIRETPTSGGSRDELKRAVERWVSVEPGLTEWKVKTDGKMIRVPDPPANRGYLGDWSTSSRALLVGKCPAGIQAAEILRAVGQQSEVEVHARGVAGISALLAAAQDNRIKKVWLERTPYSVRAALNGPIIRNGYHSLIPGFALKWDLKDLVDLIGKDRVVWIDPTDWMGKTVHLDGSIYRYSSGDANAKPLTPGS